MNRKDISNSVATLLIVDDEPTVAQLLRFLVERRGHQAIIAASSQEALLAYAAYKEDISLVIAELRMPVMSGDKLIRELVRLDPQVRVLISTSGLREEAQGLLQEQNVCGILQKPYSPKLLFQQIEQALA